MEPPMLAVSASSPVRDPQPTVNKINPTRGKLSWRMVWSTHAKRGQTNRQQSQLCLKKALPYVIVSSRGVPEAISAWYRSEVTRFSPLLSP
jgi:hypothetical protein